MARIDLLNPNVGLGSVMPSPETTHLPEIRQIGSQKPAEVKLDELYTKNAPKAAIIKTFEPAISTDEILQPAVFNRNLNSAIETLSVVKDADVRTFVQEDLYPLAENRDLLRSYLNMMVGG